MSLTDRMNAGLRHVPAWPVYLVGAGWGGWLFFLAASGQLGVDPIEALEHAYGEVALNLIVAGLAVSPVRQILGLNLLKFRRAIGVLTFFFVLAHFLVWAILDVQSLSRIWADVVKRPYVTVGMLAFAMLIPLAITSNDLALRKLGGVQWRLLHKLTYLVAVLGAAHFIWLAKGFQLEPMVYLAIILGLLALRLPPVKARVAKTRRSSRPRLGL